MEINGIVQRASCYLCLVRKPQSCEDLFSCSAVFAFVSLFDLCLVFGSFTPDTASQTFIFTAPPP